MQPNKFTPEQQQEIDRMIDKKISSLFKNEKYVFSKDIQILDNRTIQVGTNKGLQIGTSATQKIALFGSTPVVKASAVTAPTNAGGLYDQTVAQTTVDAVKAIILIIKNIGISS
ncbi:MAG: hypothetical protein WC724_03830 [Candidatus Paceibacterota bacterium]|jgi:hypothetical protein